jgi:hypothetical protein
MLLNTKDGEMKKYDIKRSAKRIRVEMPVHLDQGSGVTRDVSQSGVFFFTDQTFSPGMPLSFILELDYVFPGEPVYLHCRGNVMRVEAVGEKMGVAASISEFWSAA